MTNEPLSFDEFRVGWALTPAGEELLADPVAAVLLREEPEEELPPEDAEAVEEPAPAPED